MSALKTLFSLPGIRRAWPASSGALTFEQVDEQGRLRAGQVLADGTVRLTAYCSDRKLPSLAAESGQLLVHRYAKRAVVRHSDWVSKHLRPGKATQLAQLSSTIGTACQQVGIGAATVLSSSQSQVQFSLLPGESLLVCSDKQAGWQSFLEKLPAFHRLAPEGLTLSCHSAQREVEVLNSWLEKAQAYGALPQLAAFKTLAGKISKELAQKADSPVLLHRDLHDKQVLWDGQTISLLDLDTAALGEAALDYGNLLAHLDLRLCQGRLTAQEAQELKALVKERALSQGVSPDRLNTYQGAAALRLACVYAFRPSETHWHANWCQQVLNKTL